MARLHQHFWLQSIPVTDGDKKVFRHGGEKLEISNVQLLHLDGLTELNNKPVQKGKGI